MEPQMGSPQAPGLAEGGSMSFCVLICGGRDYVDRERLFATLDRYHADAHFTLIIHGAARGADALADQWASYRNVMCRAYPAEWRKHGAAAGPRRTAKMIEEGKPDLVIAFPTGGPGTADMMHKARAAGVEVVAVVPLKAIR